MSSVDSVISKINYLNKVLHDVMNELIVLLNSDNNACKIKEKINNVRFELLELVANINNIIDLYCGILGIDNKKFLEEVEQYRGSVKGYLRVKYVRCGKKGCKCNYGELHGPYIYKVIRYKVRGKVRERWIYLGKVKE